MATDLGRMIERRDRLVRVAERWTARLPWAAEIANNLAGCDPRDVTVYGTAANLERRRMQLGFALAADDVTPMAEALVEEYRAACLDEGAWAAVADGIELELAEEDAIDGWRTR